MDTNDTTGYTVLDPHALPSAPSRLSSALSHPTSIPVPQATLPGDAPCHTTSHGEGTPQHRPDKPPTAQDPGTATSHYHTVPHAAHPPTVNHVNYPTSPQMTGNTDHNTSPLSQDTQIITLPSSPALPAPSCHPLITQLMIIYTNVRETGVPNYKQARISLPRGLNIPAWRQLTHGHHDTALVDLLEYGFPLGFDGPIPTPCWENHQSATCFPTQVKNYLHTETSQGAMMGPFSDVPFTWAQVSPLMSRPKKGSINGDRRIIVDLSYPPHASVNTFTPRDTYLGTPTKVSLPGADQLIQLIIEAGPNCHLYSCDIARAYRHIPTDPLSWPLLCIQFDGNVYCDVSLPFGARWSASACQRMTDAIKYSMAQAGFTILNYIDDLCGVATSLEEALAGFSHLQHTLATLGLQEAKHKACPPARSLIWLGIQFDIENMITKIPLQKLNDTLNIVHKWQTKTTASLTDLRSLLGKLLHISQCSQGARLFLNRLLCMLRSATINTTRIPLTTPAQKDLAWFSQHLSQSNGINMIRTPDDHTVKISADSCLSGGGAVCGSNCYHYEFPEFIMQQQISICHKEALNCLISVKLWANMLSDTNVTLYCDSMVAVCALGSCRGRDELLLTIARELWLICARYDIHLNIKHMPGSEMEGGADALSRYHLDKSYRDLSNNLISNNHLTVWEVDPYLFKLNTSL